MNYQKSNQSSNRKMTTTTTTTAGNEKEEEEVTVELVNRYIQPHATDTNKQQQYIKMTIDSKHY